ncbi:MAG: mannitol dehydrogenase family protein [Bacteroidia bacterium]
METSVSLNQNNLQQLDKRIAYPHYDRSQVKAGIAHIGVGGFHRAHQAYYTHLLMQKGEAMDWGICGIGLRKGDRKIKESLERQDFLYTLIVRHPDTKVASIVIGSIVDFLLSEDSPSAVIDKLASPAIKIVSLTITEGGYNFDPATGEFDFDNTEVKHDLDNPQSPKTVFGYLTAALKKRQESGISPFTIQSCDNLQHNGDVTRKMLLAFAHRQEPQLAQWIADNVCFPNAMVDRITPLTTQSDIEYLETHQGLKDEWPVTCEPFCQWVIEDDFSDARPQWENVGAQFVPDVTPYEKMKIRLLNAGHSVLGLLGSLHGHETIDGCMTDALFIKYLRRFMDVEATPVLDPVEGIDLESYKDSLLERFANPNIKDKLSRICLESSAKLPKFLLSTIEENLKQGGSIQYACLVIAAWCYYSDKGVNKDGLPLEIVDAMKQSLHEAAKESGTDKLAFLKIKTVFGDLYRKKRFAELYEEMIDKIYQNPDTSVHMQNLLETDEKI